jgi:Lar family restriction alleviation protein
MADLKPCPFCGGEGVPASKPHSSSDTAYFIRCTSCACEGPWFKTPGNAVQFWNTRVFVQKKQRPAPTPKPENVQPEWLQKMTVGIAEARKYVCMLEGERFAIVKSPGGHWGDNSGRHYGSVEFEVVDKQHPLAYVVGQGIMRASTRIKYGGRINKTHKDLFKQLVQLTDRDKMLEMLKENVKEGQ